MATPREVLVVVDRWFGWLLGGWDRKYTISAMWGSHSCVLCKWGCKALHLIDKNHCRDAAKNEGLQPADHAQ